MDNIKEEILKNSPRRMLPSPETAHIPGIIDDSPISESHLPAEEYIGYIQICVELSLYRLTVHSLICGSTECYTEFSRKAGLAPRICLLLDPSQDHPYKTNKL